MVHAIGRSEVYIRCYGYFETSCDFIFFLYSELIFAYLGISGVYVTESDGYYRPQYCEVCEMVADGMYLFFWESNKGMVYAKKNIIDNADKEKVNYSNKPKWSKCDEKIWKEGTSTLLYHLSNNVGKRETQKK